MFIEANVEVIVADISRGADSIPKSSQAVRSAQADLPPVRFPLNDRENGNEQGATFPRMCALRSEAQRDCPKAGPKRG